MESSSSRIVQAIEKETRDNVFDHSKDNGYEVQQFATSEEFLLDENLIPELLGFSPSSSPTLLPTESPNDSYSSALTLRTSQTAQRNYFSPDELYATFASYCPSLAFDEDYYDNLSDHVTEILPSPKNNLLQPEYDWSEGQETSLFTVKASLVWIVVSLGLGIWLFLLHIVLKAATAIYHTSSKSTARSNPIKTKNRTNQLRRPPLEDHREKQHHDLSMKKYMFSKAGGNVDKKEKETKSISKKNKLILQAFEKQPHGPPVKRRMLVNGDGNNSSVKKEMLYNVAGNVYRENETISAKRKLILQALKKKHHHPQVEKHMYADANKKENKSISKKTRLILKAFGSCTSSTMIQISQDMHSNGIIYTRENDESKAKVVISSSSSGKESSKKANTTVHAFIDCQVPKSKGCVVEERTFEEEPCFIPVLPIMSDLTSPPGLSLSSSSSSTSSPLKDGYGGRPTEDASIEVLATDDIYTGNTAASASASIQTPAVYYLSYCLEESDSDATQRLLYQTQCDYYSDSLLLSPKSIHSSPSAIESSTKSGKRNTAHRSIPQVDIQNIYAPDLNKSNGRIDHALPSNDKRTEMNSSVHNTNYQRASHTIPTANIGNGDNGGYSFMGERINCRTEPASSSCLHSFQNFVQQGKLNERSNNLSMLFLCDDSNSTINLLADSDSSQISSENIGSYNGKFRHFAKAPSLTTQVFLKQISAGDETNQRNSRDLRDTGAERRQVEGYRRTQKPPISSGKIEARPTDGSPTDRKELYLPRSQKNDHGFTQSMTDDLEALLFETETRSQSEKGSAISCRLLGSIRGRRIVVALSCVPLIIVVILFLTMGISELYRVQKIVGVDFDSMMNKMTSPFTAFDNNDLYAFLGELELRRQELYFNLDDHCPKVSSSICDYAFVSSSCDLDGVPLKNHWTELLIESDKLSQNVQKDPLFNWFINAREQSMSLFFILENRLRNEIEKWKWYIVTALITSVGMVLLAVGALFTLLYPMLETNCNDNRKKRRSYSKFGRHHYASPALDTYSSFFFCTGRSFTIIFWSLFVASWLLGMAFAITMIATDDVCDSEQPYSILANEFESWEESNTGFDLYITKFWRQQLHFCGRTPALNGPNNIAPDALIERIEALSNLIGPTQFIIDGLQNMTSSGIYQDVCGGDSALILRAIEEMRFQLCSDAEFVTNAYLEIMSCGSSSWVPLYDTIVNDTICNRGLGGLQWSMAMQISILFFALILWAFRSTFLVPFDMN